EFGVLSTPVPGIRVSEPFPRLARLAQHFALLRSVYHGQGDHVLAHQQMLCGQANLDTPFPNPGAVIARLRGGSGQMPPFVVLPRLLTLTTFGTSQLGQDAGVMGRAFDPLVPESTPQVAEKGVEALQQGDILYRIRDLGLPGEVAQNRFERRRHLLERLALDARIRLGAPAAQADEAQRRAFELITSPDARRAFDLTGEPTALRDRYGRNYVGIGALLARRLVEAGSRFVTVNFQGFTSGWDTHNDNFRAIRERLGPTLDAALSTLIVDLADRGLLETTLVLCLGEFGRGPGLEGAAGRGHWPHCFTVLAAGGGVRGGQVIGASDSLGQYPAERPIPSHDLIATLYDRFGLHADTTYTTLDGRPQPLAPGAQVIRELF
ncbi:MAG: DUF1501 domain-containing protein, partial [Armatimonadetes bacterium]|nr:DUF1501 domain-containing protein [Armatimonadota bacterium]